MSFVVQPVEKIGTYTSNGYICGRIRAVEMPLYPSHPEGQALREHRVNLQLGLREAARAAALKPSELSSLEDGSGRLASAEEWGRLRGVLARYVREQQRG